MPTPTSPSCRPTAAPCAPSSTTCSPMRIRYTPPDGEILLAAEEIKDFVQFTVRDTGRGIEAERLEHHLRPLQHLL